MTSPTTDRRLGLAGNTAIKAPVTVVAASNITLSGEQTIDSIAVLASNAAGVPDRVLCTAQTDGTENGIYDVATGAWTRSLDANGNYDLTQGTMVPVARGTTYARTYWNLTTAAPITIDTTSQTWAISQTLTSTSAFMATVLPAANAAAARVLLGIDASNQSVLRRTSATQCTLSRCNGTSISVNGVMLTIPSAGVVIDNTGLSANTRYYAYAYSSAGSLAVEWSATAPTNKYTGLDAAGNRNKTADTSRTLVGMATTNASSQFEWNITNRMVRSWMNDAGVTVQCQYASSNAVSSPTYAEIHSGYRAKVLLWEGEVYSVSGKAVARDTGGGSGEVYITHADDSAVPGLFAIGGFFAAIYTNGATTYRSDTYQYTSTTPAAADGVVTSTVYGYSSGGTTPTLYGTATTFQISSTRQP